MKTAGRTNDLSIFGVFAKGEKKVKVFISESLGYTRVSDPRQEERLSLGTQRRGIESYEKKHGLNIIEWFGGKSESAKNNDRKEFKRMIAYIKTSKRKIGQILVYSLDRWTRNEETLWLMSQLRKMGIEIISVTQPMDVTTTSGRLQQKITVLFNEHDNELRRDKSMAGMRDMMLINGEWPHKAPIGYDHLKINDKRTIVVNDTGRLIRKAFHWKANENITNEEIRRRLAAHGLNLPPRALSEMFRNPFYCGIMVHNLLEGEVKEHIYEKIVSREIFIKVNDLLKTNPQGYKQKEENNLVPLKRFLRCAECGSFMRGYISRGVNKSGNKTPWSIPYYKCNTTGCKCNKSAAYLHERFTTMLAGYKLDEKYMELVKFQMIATYNEQNKTREENSKAIQQKIAEVDKKLEKLEDRYVIEGELTPEQYMKGKAKLMAEREKFEKELPKLQFEKSKLEKCISFAVNIALNLPELWASSAYAARQKLQKLLFPEGISYNKQKDECRSEQANGLFTRIAEIARLLEANRITSMSKLQKNSVWSP